MLVRPRGLAGLSDAVAGGDSLHGLAVGAAWFADYVTGQFDHVALWGRNIGQAGVTEVWRDGLGLYYAAVLDLLHDPRSGPWFAFRTKPQIRRVS